MSRVLFTVFIIDCLVCSSISLPVFAQTTKVLTLNLDTAINQAQANNPQLLAAQRSINVARSGATIAGTTLNPRLSIDIPFGQAETKHTISLEQPIELGGKRGARLAVAKVQIQQAQLQLDLLRYPKGMKRSALSQIRSQVRQSYAELAIAQGAQQNTEQSLSINQQLVDIAKARLAAGDVAGVDVVQAEFAFSQAQQKLEPAINRVRQAVIRLNSLLGQAADTPIKLVDGEAFRFSLTGNKQGLAVSQKLPDLTALRQLARSSRLDLLLAGQQIQLGAKQIRLAQSAQIPDISLAAAFVWDPGFSTSSTPSPPTTTAVILGVRVDLPLFNNNRGGVSQAQANRSVAVAQLSALEQQVNTEVITAYENAASAQRVVERDRTILLPQALQVLNLSRKSYQYGQTGLNDALLVQQSVQTVFDNFYADILTYQTALGTLEQAVNQPLSQINQTNAPIPR